MGGLKFLNLKGWHPSNARNQKLIWIAEQSAKDLEQREREAAAEVRKNADLQRFQQLAAENGDEESVRRGARQQVGFLYAPPPGLKKAEGEAANTHDSTEDDAVRAFRRRLQERSGGATATHENRSSSGSGDSRTGITTGNTSDHIPDNDNGHGGGARGSQRNLERYVGRRPDETLTIKEQVERFPQLRDAPVEGDYTASVRVNFKPMGLQLRNVRCIRCKEWGHQSGDRECALRDANPHDADRLAREDPMASIAKLSQDKKQELVLRRGALPLEMAADSQVEAYEILLSDEDSADADREFISSLSTREKRSLLKKLRKQAERNRKASSLRERRRGSDDSDSDSSEASSDDSADRSRRRSARTHKHKHKHRHRRKSERKHKSKRKHSRHQQDSLDAAPPYKRKHTDDDEHSSTKTSESKRRRHGQSSDSRNQYRSHGRSRGRSLSRSRGRSYTRTRASTES